MRRTCALALVLTAMGASAQTDKVVPKIPPPTLAQIQDPAELFYRIEEEGALARLEALLNQGADVNAADSTGRSLLARAMRSSAEAASSAPSDVMRGRDEHIQLLLRKGASPCGKPGTETPLHAATHQGDLYWIATLLEKKCDLHSPDSRGNTPLHTAAWLQVEAVRLLLSRGAKPEIRNKEGDTPLRLAALYFKNPEMVSALLEFGADPNKALEDIRRSSQLRGDLRMAPIVDLLEKTVQGKRPARRPVMGKPLMPPREDSPFIRAIREDRREAALELLGKGADPNSLSAPFNRFKHHFNEAASYGTSALHLAILKKNARLARALVEKGAKVNLRGAVSDYHGGDTPLTLAAAADDLEMAKYLLAHRAGANVPAAKGEAPLFVAKDPELIRLLVSQGADLNRTLLSGTPLHYAIMSKQPAKARLLLELGANPNARDRFTAATPIFKAIEADDEEMLALLLSKGADPQLKNAEGLNAFEFALHRKKEKLASLLKSKTGEGYADLKRALSQAIHDRNVGWVRDLLKQRLDVNGNAEWPYLIQAAQFNRKKPELLQIIRLLIESGADVKVVNSNRQGLLHLVHDVDTARLIVSRGLGVNQPDDQGNTPLHVAAVQGELEMVEFLLSKGAPVSPTDRMEQTPLHGAAHGPIDHRPGDGPPPAWEAEGPRYVRILELLVKAGADTKAPSGLEKATPVDLASKWAHPGWRKKALAALGRP